MNDTLYYRMRFFLRKRLRRRCFYHGDYRGSGVWTSSLYMDTLLSLIIYLFCGAFPLYMISDKTRYDFRQKPG